MSIIAETNRLIIRTWILEEDARQAFEIYGDPEVTQFLISKVDSVESQKKTTSTLGYKSYETELKMFKLEANTWKQVTLSDNYHDPNDNISGE